MTIKTQTRNVPALSMRGSFSPKSVNDEARTVEVVWTTGARVLRGYYERFWEELSLDPKHVRLDRLNGGAPFLPDHDGSAISRTLGVVESAKLEGKRGTAVIRFPSEGTSPEADKVFRLVKEGIVQNVSVGYRVHKMEKTEDGADKIPVYRAVDWEPYEISAVAMGADAGAGFRSASVEQENVCTFITRGEPQQEKSKMTPEEIEAARLAEEKRAAELKATAEAAAVKAERERASEIRKLVRTVKLGDEMAERMVNDGTTVDAARAAIFEALAKRSDETAIDGHVRVEVGEGDRDKFIRGVSAGMFERSGTVRLIEQAKAKGAKGFEKVELDGGEFRGMSFSDIARACLERRGVSTRGLFSKEDLFSRALSQRAGYAGTSDFAVLFENVMHKQMLAAYAVQSDTWRRWCGTDTVVDFRDSNRFRNGSFGTLDDLDENGEYKNKSIPDGQKTSINTATKGNIIGVSRQMLINDDMGAMSDLATRFGRSAGLSIEVAAYAMLLDNSGLGPTLSDGLTFFHATRGNIGTGAALSVASLTTDKVLMRKQQDLSSNEYIDLIPRILLVPVELEADANLINVNQTDPTASATTGKANVAKGMFGDIVSSPRLTSATRRWMFTDGKEAFKVVFLAGSGEGPRMETQNGWRTDGMEWKCGLDFKVNPFDPKTALVNAGA
jgi:HK97 family phage prohead protease